MTALADEVNTNETSRTPQFCSVCGSRLVPNSEITGYDPYTGFPVENQSLRCNNPTVISKLGVKSTTHHPTWDRYNGVWEQN